MKNIIFVGFMGTGKTAAAKALAKKLGRKYVSLDNLIEKREKKPISRIFKELGEPYFREVEKEVTKEAAAEDNLIIDAGGGVVLADENWIAFRRNGIVICLTARPEVILNRVKRHRHRPLLNVNNPKAKIVELLNKRLPFYNKADFKIDTSGLNIGEVIEKVMEITKFNDNR